MTPILTSCAKGTAAMMAPVWRETRPAGPQRRPGRANGTARVTQAALLKDCPATSYSSLLCSSRKKGGALNRAKSLRKMDSRTGRIILSQRPPGDGTRSRLAL